MGFVLIALVAVALTAAFVLSEAIGTHDRSDQPVETGPPAVLGASASALELVDAPTQGMSLDLLEAPTEVSLPSAETILPAHRPVIGQPHLQPDPERLIQHEVLLPADPREQSVAMTKLAVAIAGSGVVLGLGILGIGRGVNALIRLLTGA